MKHWVYMERGEPTESELEIVALMFKGLSYAEIAKHRGRSVKTVGTQISRLLAETNTHNSRELMYEALTRGWVKPPDVRG